MLTNAAHMANDSHGVALMWRKVPSPFPILPTVVVWYDDVPCVAAANANTSGILFFLRLFLHGLDSPLAQFLAHCGKMFTNKIRGLFPFAYRGDSCHQIRCGVALETPQPVPNFVSFGPIRGSVAKCRRV
jgi:hypothetical protein